MALWSFPCGKFPPPRPKKRLTWWNYSLDVGGEQGNGPGTWWFGTSRPETFKINEQSNDDHDDQQYLFVPGELFHEVFKEQVAVFHQKAPNHLFCWKFVTVLFNSGWEDDIFEILKGITSSSWKQSSSPSWRSSMREISNLVDCDHHHHLLENHHHHLLENHHHHPDEKNLISNLVDCDPVWGGRMVLQ